MYRVGLRVLLLATLTCERLLAGGYGHSRTQSVPLRGLHRVSQRYVELQASRRGTPVTFGRRLAEMLPPLTECIGSGSSECYDGVINGFSRSVSGDVGVTVAPVCVGPTTPIANGSRAADEALLNEIAWAVNGGAPRQDLRGNPQTAPGFDGTVDVIGRFNDEMFRCLALVNSGMRYGECLRDAAVELAQGLRQGARQSQLRADRAKLYAGAICAGSRKLASVEGSVARSLPLTTGR